MDSKGPDQTAWCAHLLSDQNLHYPETETLDTLERINGQQRPGWYFAHVQADMNLRILHMFEGTFFFLDEAHKIYCIKNQHYELCKQ